MPIWGWLLVGFGILVLGAGWWLLLLLDLKNRGERLLKVAQPVLAEIEKLSNAQQTPGEYLKPAPDTQSDPRKMEAAWLRRKAASEQKKADRQRRLIARLRK